MIDEAGLARMSPQERAELARALAALDAPLPASPRIRRRQRLLAVAALAGVVVLAGWIVVLAVTLPRYYQAGGWRVAWVGFDVILAAVFAATAWAAWRRRQVLIVLLIVLATLLCGDAWFDTTLDWRTSGFLVAVLMALCVELPVAAAALVVARRLMRLTMSRLEALEGVPGPAPSLWRMQLFGEAPGGYRDLFRRPGSPSPPGRRVRAGAAGGQGRPEG